MLFVRTVYVYAGLPPRRLYFYALSWLLPSNACFGTAKAAVFSSVLYVGRIEVVISGCLVLSWKRINLACRFVLG